MDGIDVLSHDSEPSRSQNPFSGQHLLQDLGQLGFERLILGGNGECEIEINTGLQQQR